MPAVTAHSAQTTATHAGDNSIVKVIFASAAGTMIEWYDFYLFALIGTVVAPQFYQSATELGCGHFVAGHIRRWIHRAPVWCNRVRAAG